MEQAELGLDGVNLAVAEITVTVRLTRLPGRQKCSRCGVRRVLFAMSVVGLVQGSAKCAKCMGLR